MNRIVFLGTGNAFHTKRAQTSLYVSINNEEFLLDCGGGPETVRNLLASKSTPCAIKNIFLTHHHGDHSLGLVHVVHWALVKDTQATITIYGPRQAILFAKRIVFGAYNFPVHMKRRLVFTPIRSIDTVRFSNISIQATKVKAQDWKSSICFAYKIIYNSLRVVFTSDMQPNTNMNVFARNATVLIHDAMGLVKDEEFIHSCGHSSAKDAAMLAEKCHVTTLVLTHLQESPGIEKQIYNEAKKYFRGKVIVAEDLLSLQL